jgi:glycosyltransferase involved in cell wall biosynthesis
LRVALTADPYIPVPPTHYGGIERVVHLLAEQLVARGHTVTLFAHPFSHVSGTALVPYGVEPHAGAVPRAREVAQLGGALWRRRRQFDLIHSFGRLAALLPVLACRSLPKIQSYQRSIPWRGVRRASRIAGSSLRFTACSASLFGQIRAGDGRWRAIFNGVDLGRYRFAAQVPPDAPLVYLGRIERVKGVHLAIDIARRAARRLVIAGSPVDQAGREYFTTEIAPAIDGDCVQHVGSVNDEQKDRLLRGAAALLFPIQWEEPFGIVMAEAMACGTPVIAWPRGSVREVVRPGVNGFICQSVEDAAAAVEGLGSLDRRRVRLDCEARFDARAIATQYEAMYAEALR